MSGKRNPEQKGVGKGLKPNREVKAGARGLGLLTMVLEAFRAPATKGRKKLKK